jgi:hypothetical protein
MMHQPFERLGHVAVAHVPGFGPAPHHRPVVGLGVLQHECVLLGSELLLASFARRGWSLPELPQESDDLFLARSVNEPRGTGVLAHVLAVPLEALEGPPCGRQGAGVVAVEVRHDGVEGFPEAVDVEPVEADSLLFGPELIVLVKPLRQGDDLLIGPHPARPACEASQRFAGTLSRRVQSPDVAVDAETVRPVPLHRDERESLLGDQPTGDLAPPGVVFGGAVRGLTRQDVAAIADPIEQRVEITRSLERERSRPDLGDQFLGHRRSSSMEPTEIAHSADRCTPSGKHLAWGSPIGTDSRRPKPRTQRSSRNFPGSADRSCPSRCEAICVPLRHHVRPGLSRDRGRDQSNFLTITRVPWTSTTSTRESVST